MAKFTQTPDIDLEDNEKKKFVVIKGKADIEFDEHEKNIEWEFKVEIFDKLNNNELIASVSRIFKPKKLKSTQKVNEKIERAKFKNNLSEMDISFKFFLTHLE